MTQVNEPTTSVNITRDALTRPTLFTDTLNNTTQTHGYDLMSQVVSSQFSLWGAPKNYAYDLGGNLLSNLEPSGTGSWANYASGSNRLSATGMQTNGVPGASQAVVHDAMGNIYTAGADTITYDATGRLSQWTDGSDTTRMYYNPMGQRVKKIVTGVNAGITLEAYDDQGRLLGVYAPNGSGGLTVVEELVHLDGWRTVATIRPDVSLGMASPVVYPIVSDHLGSPRKILDQAGTLLWSWTNTEPYGNQAPNEAHTATSFIYDGRFPGQRFDRSTGTLHNGFRTYSPKLGRYMQSDPLGLEAGWNTYAYVGGNPMSGVDPLGLYETPADIMLKATNSAMESKLPGERNGPQDAYRHCVASCEMARVHTKWVSMALGEAHEQFGNFFGQPTQECLMDRFNNLTGTGFGSSSATFEQCEQKCFGAVKSGRLLQFNNNKKQYWPVPWGNEYLPPQKTQGR